MGEIYTVSTAKEVTQQLNLEEIQLVSRAGLELVNIGFQVRCQTASFQIGGRGNMDTFGKYYSNSFLWRIENLVSASFAFAGDLLL